MAGPIRFTDGDAYEQSMGAWSTTTGAVLLDWLALPAGLSWLDVGCGTGAFTELIRRRCMPAELAGVDPSAAQLGFARHRPGMASVAFQQGDAMALPYPDRRFDAAVMALVIAFVPDAARGVAEMARVVRPGGSVSAYMWDIAGGGLPTALVHQAMQTLGLDPPRPPNPAIATLDAMRALWIDAGMAEVQTRVIDVQQRFAHFDAFWTQMRLMPSTSAVIARVGEDAAPAIKAELRSRIVDDADGGITHRARANAVRGRVPVAG